MVSDNSPKKAQSCETTELSWTFDRTACVSIKSKEKMRALIFMLVLEGGRNRFLFSFHYSQSVVSPVVL
jgi:hypothetical protein